MKKVTDYLKDFNETLNNLNMVVSPELRTNIMFLYEEFIKNLKPGLDKRLNENSKYEIWQEAKEPIVEYQKKLKMYSIFSDSFYQAIFVTPMIQIDNYYRNNQF